MVVILLLAPSTTNGCDASDESTTSTSTSSTATTAIPAAIYRTRTSSAPSPLRRSYPTSEAPPRKPHNVTFDFDRLSHVTNAIPKPPRQKNFVRHVTRVNFYDSQVEVGDDGDTEAVTKEGEY